MNEHEQNRLAFGAGIKPIYKNYLEEFSRQGPKTVTTEPAATWVPNRFYSTRASEGKDMIGSASFWFYTDGEHDRLQECHADGAQSQAKWPLSVASLVGLWQCSFFS